MLVKLKDNLCQILFNYESFSCLFIQNHFSTFYKQQTPWDYSRNIENEISSFNFPSFPIELYRLDVETK